MIIIFDSMGKRINDFGKNPLFPDGVPYEPQQGEIVYRIDDNDPWVDEYLNSDISKATATIVNGQVDSIILSPFTPDLYATKQAKIAELLSNRETAIYAGFTSPTMGHDYFYGEVDVRKLQGQASLLALDPSIASVDWLTKDSGLVTHTRGQFIAVLKEGGQHERDQHTKFYSLKEQVEAVATIADVEAIVW